MTFPATLKKSGPISISKTGSASKTLSPGSPRSPVSPLNAPAKLISGSSVKARQTSKPLEKTNVESSVKAPPMNKPSEKINVGSPAKTPLTNKSSEKTNVGFPVKAPSTNKPSEKNNVGSPVIKLSVSSKSPAVKAVTKPIIDAKPEPEKIATSAAAKGVTKSAMKPPPLKLNIKSTDSKGLQSPSTSKSVPKTPTTPSVKTLTLTKSPMATKSTLVAKSPSVSSGFVQSPTSTAKSSQGSTVSLSATKSQLTTGNISSTTSLDVKLPIVSSPVTKSLSIAKSPSAAKSPSVSKTSTITSTVPKSPRMSSNLSTLSIPSKDQSMVMKPTTPVKKAAVSSTKSVTGSKPSTTSTAKSSMVPRSPSTASSIKSISLKTPLSPSKLLTKEPSAVKVSSTLKPTVIKSNIISKPDSTSSKIMTQKESSTLSLASVKSSSTIKSTMSTIKSTSSTIKSATSTIKSTTSTISPASTMPKTTSEKAKVITPTSVPKSVVPKSPIAKTQSLKGTKTTQSSPTVKTSLSSVVKTKAPLSPTVKSKTPTSLTVKPRTLSLSLEKSPMSPTVKKAVPTKLILSPGLPPKTMSLSSSRLSSISTESLSSRSYLKSPISPKPTKVVTKNLSKLIKKSEESQTKSIRGGQPLKKTIDIPGITELPSNILLEKQENSYVDCRLEKKIENNLKEEIESTEIIQDSSPSEELESILISVSNIDNGIKGISDFANEDALSNVTNDQHSNPSSIVQDCNLITIKEDSIAESSIQLKDSIVESSIQQEDSIIESSIHQEDSIVESSIHQEDSIVVSSIHQEDSIVVSSIHHTSVTLLEELKQNEDEEDYSLDFEIVKKDECEPRLSSISHNNCDILFDDKHFDTTNDNVVSEQLNVTESYILDSEDSFEPMNDKLILGDVPFETDSCQSDVSDNEQTIQKEIINEENCNLTKKNCIDDVFLFSEHDLSINNLDRSDSTDSFIHQFMPKSVKQCEGASSISSTDDESFLSRKSYSEVVSGTPKDGEYYYDYDMGIADDSLDYEDEEKSVFVEVTEKEFPELKPKDISGKRKIKKQKKRNFSNRTGSQSDDSSTSDNDYNPKDFDGNEFCHYIKMMKDCSFYPNGLFSSDTVKLSTSSSLSWLDISVRTTDDDLIPSTESLSTYEVFQASNLNKDFLMSIISPTTENSPIETSWFWKSIEGRHQSNNKTNITLSLKPRPKHLTTPRFMTLLALISEAKGYEIKPSLSEHFVTTDCMPRFDDKIRRLMVQGFWLVGRLIKESLSEDENINCGNPFKFIDGDIGFWWAGINMLDWQEYMKECGKNEKPVNCYEFVVQNMKEKRHNFTEAELSMNAVPDDFMSELDMENFIDTVRNVKYYSSSCFVDSAENEDIVETCEDDNLTEWEKSTVEQH